MILMECLVRGENIVQCNPLSVDGICSLVQCNFYFFDKISNLLMQFAPLCFEARGMRGRNWQLVKSPGLPCIIAKIGDCGGREGVHSAECIIA